MYQLFAQKTMKNTPRGCLTAGGSQPPRVVSHLSYFIVSVSKHSNSLRVIKD